MTFDVTYQGKVMQGTDLPIYAERADGRFASTWVSGQSARVALTGYTAVSPKGNTHYQTTSGGWIYLPDGWEQVGTQAINQYSQSQAQALVDKIMRNNAVILCNNLLCARYANRLTVNQQAAVRKLQDRLVARNDALQIEGLVQVQKKQYPDGFADLEPYLQKLMDGESVGIATWVWIVVACVVIATASTAAYFAYKSLADESEADVKYSKELTRVLTSKLTEEEYNQLLNETRGIVTKSKIKTLIRTSVNWLTYAAVAVGGYMAYKLLKR